MIEKISVLLAVIFYIGILTAISVHIIKEQRTPVTINIEEPKPNPKTIRTSNQAWFSRNGIDVDVQFVPRIPANICYAERCVTARQLAEFIITTGQPKEH